MSIRLLDCTLRDGGFVNDWKFGSETIKSILKHLTMAQLEIIEVGFLDARRTFDADRTIQPNTAAFDKILADIDTEKTMLVAMLDYGTCGLENIAPCGQSLLDGIRLIFKRPNMKYAVSFGKSLSELGYKVFLQLVSITSYSDRLLLDFAALANEASPYTVSIVDTYGLMHADEMKHYFYLLDQNLRPEIKLGFHAHNNFQLAYANSCEFLQCDTARDLIADGTVYGMGKGAGNAPIECLAMYANRFFEKAYSIDRILPIIEDHILQMYGEAAWGYRLPHFLSALHNIHPKYIQYLMERKFRIAVVNDIVAKIPNNCKLDFSGEIIEKLLFIHYLSKRKQEGIDSWDC